MKIAHYLEKVKQSDKMPDHVQPLQYGVFSELGTIMTELKKQARENSSMRIEIVEEELGDIFWYISAISRRKKVDLLAVLSKISTSHKNEVASTSEKGFPIALANDFSSKSNSKEVFSYVAMSSVKILELDEFSDQYSETIESFLVHYFNLCSHLKVNFKSVLESNLKKVLGRFCEPDVNELIQYDKYFPFEEQFPRKFTVIIRKNGAEKSIMQIRGLTIGSPLTDNIINPDGYQFHDILHLAHATVLNWSPTLRALLKRKRKSNPKIDECEDGGRAIVIEEGLTAWVFNHAKEERFFEHTESLKFDMLKRIQEFVSGYEVESAPLKLWEDAILQGYQVFRSVVKHEGGIISCDLDRRRINFRELKKS